MIEYKLMKTKSPTWQDVKKHVIGFDQRKIVDLIRDMYHLSSDNKTFLHIVPIGGKNRKIPLPSKNDGMSIDEFIRRNADPIFLHDNEMWEYLEDDQGEGYEDE